MPAKKKARHDPRFWWEPTDSPRQEKWWEAAPFPSHARARIEADPVYRRELWELRESLGYTIQAEFAKRTVAMVAKLPTLTLKSAPRYLQRVALAVELDQISSQQANTLIYAAQLLIAIHKHKPPRASRARKQVPEAHQPASDAATGHLAPQTAPRFFLPSGSEGM